jgi:hypothetical protein
MPDIAGLISSVSASVCAKLLQPASIPAKQAFSTEERDQRFP